MIAVRLMPVALVIVLLVLPEGDLTAQVTRGQSVSGDPQGEWIVFVSGRSGSGDIYGVDPSNGSEVIVVGSPLRESGVRFDRYNKRLVHQSYEAGHTNLVSGVDRLFRDPSSDVAPAWSPDGWRIVYAADQNGMEDLFLARPDGTGASSITKDPEPDRYPAWSPDGRKVVFARRVEGAWDLYVINLVEPSFVPERLTDLAVYVGHPAWSPDGGTIAFDMMFDGQTEIVTIDVTSKELRRLTDRPGNDLVPSWSADGGRIAFGGQPDSTLNWDVWSVDVKTLELERHTTDPAFDGGPVFVPRYVVTGER